MLLRKLVKLFWSASILITERISTIRLPMRIVYNMLRKQDALRLSEFLPEVSASPTSRGLSTRSRNLVPAEVSVCHDKDRAEGYPIPSN